MLARSVAHAVSTGGSPQRPVHYRDDRPGRLVRRLLLRQANWLKKDAKNLTRFYTKLSLRVIFRFLGRSVRKQKNQPLQ